MNHYGHNIDVTKEPYYCSDCEVDITTSALAPGSKEAQATEQGINQKLTPIDKAQGGISE